MTSVRMRTNYAGEHGACSAGSVIDLPGDEAERVIDARSAERVIDAEETATAEPPENAASRTVASRRRAAGTTSQTASDEDDED